MIVDVPVMVHKYFKSIKLEVVPRQKDKYFILKSIFPEQKTRVPSKTKIIKKNQNLLLKARIRS